MQADSKTGSGQQSVSSSLILTNTVKETEAVTLVPRTILQPMCEECAQPVKDTLSILANDDPEPQSFQMNLWAWGRLSKEIGCSISTSFDP